MRRNGRNYEEKLKKVIRIFFMKQHLACCCGRFVVGVCGAEITYVRVTIIPPEDPALASGLRVLI